MITFLIDFWSMFGRFWGPSWLQNRSKIDQHTKISKMWKLSSRVNESSTFEDFRALRSKKIDQKSIKKLIKKMIRFSIEFLIYVYQCLKDFRPLKSSKNELSFTRELNFHNFEMLGSRSIFKRFLNDFEAQVGSKIDEKSRKSRNKNSTKKWPAEIHAGIPKYHPGSPEPGRRAPQNSSRPRHF